MDPLTLQWSNLPFHHLERILRLFRADPAAVTSGTVRDTEARLSELQRDFQYLLGVPKKSEIAANAVKSGNIEINSARIEINEVFQTDALAVSETLGIDERVSVLLLLHNRDDNRRLGLSDVQAAVDTFHSRHNCLLAVLLLVFRLGRMEPRTGQTETESRFVSALNRVTKSIITEKFVSELINAFVNIRNLYSRLEKEAEAAKLLKTSHTASIDQYRFLKRRLRHLEEAHTRIGIVLTEILQTGGFSVSGFKQLADDFFSAPHVSFKLLAYLPSLLGFLSAFRSHSVLAQKYKLSVADGETLHTYLCRTIPERLADRAKPSEAAAATTENLGFWLALLQMTFLVSYQRLCRSAAAGPDFRDQFRSRILYPCLEAVYKGGMELFLRLANTVGIPSDAAIRAAPFSDLAELLTQKIGPLPSDSVHKVLAHHPLAENDRYIPETEAGTSRTPSELSEQCADALLGVSAAIIDDFPYLLKKLQEREEEAALKLRDDWPAAGLYAHANVPRFCLGTALLLRARSGDNSAFLDSASHRHGFLMWSGSLGSRTADTCFLHLLASLCNDETAARAVHRLAAEPPNPGNGAEPRAPLLASEPGSVTIYDAVFRAMRRLETELSQQSVEDLQGSTPEAQRRAENVAQESRFAAAGAELLFRIGFVLPAALPALQQQFRAVDAVMGLLAVRGLPQKVPWLHVVRMLFAAFPSAAVWSFLDRVLLGPQIQIQTQTGPKPADYAGMLRARVEGVADTCAFLAVIVAGLSAKSEGSVYPFGSEFGEFRERKGVWPYIEYVFVHVLFRICGFRLTPEVQAELELQSYAVVAAALRIGFPVKKFGSTNSESEANSEANSPALPALNYIFTPAGYKELLNLGRDPTQSELLPSDDPRVAVLAVKLGIVTQILKSQTYFFSILLPKLRHGTELPARFPWIGQLARHDVRRLEDAMVQKLTFVVDSVALIGSSHVELCRAALGAVRNFGGPVRARLLPALLRAEETHTPVRTLLISQLEREVPAPAAAADVKLGVLQFLAATLPPAGRAEATAGHFLLGYAVPRTGTLELGPRVADGDLEAGYIRSEVSGLKSVELLVQNAFDGVGSGYVDAEAVFVLSRCLYILVRLVQNPISAEVTLAYLRAGNCFQQLLAREPLVSRQTVWGSAGGLAGGLAGGSASTLWAFVAHRVSLLRYLAVEYHASATAEALSLTNNYMRLLTGRAGGAGGVGGVGGAAGTDLLGLLDVLEVVGSGSGSTNPDGSGTESFTGFGETTESIQTPEELLQSYLEAWAELVLIVVSDRAALPPAERRVLVLELLQEIVPRLGEQWAAGQFCALCLALFAVYTEDTNAEDTETFVGGTGRLRGLFDGCLALAARAELGVPALRADVYTLGTKYLCWALRAEPGGAAALWAVCVAHGPRLVENVLADAVAGGGAVRLTALCLLEALVRLARRAGIASGASGGTAAIFGPAVCGPLVEAVERADAVLRRAAGGFPAAGLRDSNGPTVEEAQFAVEVGQKTLQTLTGIAQNRHGALELLRQDIFRRLGDLFVFSLQGSSAVELYFPVLEDSAGRVEVAVLTWESLGVRGVAELSLYDLYIPALQLVAAVLVSLGPENPKARAAGRNFLQRNQKLVVMVLYRFKEAENSRATLESGAEAEAEVEAESAAEPDSELTVLVKLVVLVVSLTGFDELKLGNGVGAEQKASQVVF